jgi:streptomycin 6-kinase
MIEVFGEDGRSWLDGLPALLDEYATRWNLDILAPFPLSYNYVAPCRREDGSPAVLKAGVQRGPVEHEMAALRHWDGDGAVRVLESDEAAAVFLLERLVPGIPIIAVDEADATSVAARLMRRIWRPPPQDHIFPTLEDWAEAFDLLRERHDRTTGLLPQVKVERGESLYRDLLASQPDEVVLHGDLHHTNILSAEREPWLIIDPHGVVGDPAFEVGPWLRNPVTDPGERYEERVLLRQPDVAGILGRRLDIFASELRLDRQRLRDWGIAFATLSACWSDDSNHTASWQQALAVADILATL